MRNGAGRPRDRLRRGRQRQGGRATDYRLIRRTGRIDVAVVEIEFLEADVEVYCFTFD